jgi:hypothetical protein
MATTITRTINLTDFISTTLPYCRHRPEFGIVRSDYGG